MLSFKSFLTSTAVFNSNLIENVDDNSIVNKTNSNIVFIEPTKYKTYNIMPVQMPTETTSSSPDSLFFILMKILLKKLTIDPMITTGWILVGNSPKITSIAIAIINANIINKNNSKESNLR